MSNGCVNIDKRGGGGKVGSLLPFVCLILLILAGNNAYAQRTEPVSATPPLATFDPYKYDPSKHESTLGPYVPNVHEPQEKLVAAQEEMLAAQKKFLEMQKSFLATHDAFVPNNETDNLALPRKLVATQENMVAAQEKLLETQESFLAMQDTYAPKTATHTSTVASGVCAPLGVRHPWYFGVFGGAMFDADLISEQVYDTKISVTTKNGGTGGLVVGYKFDDYFGLESRVHFSSGDVHLCIGNASEPLRGVKHELTLLDASFLFSPINTPKWQPYIKGGIGFGQQKFSFNAYGISIDGEPLNILTLPVGVGMRFWCNDQFGLHVDVTDNIVFGKDGTDKMQNHVALSLGILWAFGGR